MRLVLASGSPRRAELMTAAGFTFEVCVPDIDERLRPGETPREYVRRLSIEKAAAVSQVLMGPAAAQRSTGAAKAGRYMSPDEAQQFNRLIGAGPAKAGHYGRKEDLIDDPHEPPDDPAAAPGSPRDAPSGFSRIEASEAVPGVSGTRAADVVSGFNRTGASARRTRHGADDVLILAADTAVVVDDEILGKPADRADAERMLRRLSGRIHVVLTGVSVRSAARQVDDVEETLVFVRPLNDVDIAWYIDSGEGQDKAGGYAIQGLASRFVPRIEGSYSNVVGLPVARVEQLINELIKRVE